MTPSTGRGVGDKSVHALLHLPWVYQGSKKALLNEDICTLCASSALYGLDVYSCTCMDLMYMYTYVHAWIFEMVLSGKVKSRGDIQHNTICIKFKRLMDKRKWSTLRRCRPKCTYTPNTSTWLPVGYGIFKSSDTSTFFDLVHLLAPFLKVPFSVISSGSLSKDLSAYLSVSLQLSLLEAMSDQQKSTFTLSEYSPDHSNQHRTPWDWGEWRTRGLEGEDPVLLVIMSSTWELLNVFFRNQRNSGSAAVSAVSTRVNALTSLSFDFHLCQNGDNNFSSFFAGLL